MTGSRTGALVLVAALLAAPLAAQDAQSISQHALAAYKAKDFTTYLADSLQLEQLRPGHPIVLFNLAGARALNGNAAAAASTLDTLADMQVWLDVAGESDFDAVRNDPAFAKAAARVAAVLTTQKTAATIANRFDDPDLITESIAYDPQSGSFFVGSVRRQQILRVAKDGTISIFLGKAAGIESPNGMAVDGRRRLLWIVSTGSKRVEGFDPAHAKLPALFAVSLDSGSLVTKLEGNAGQFFDSVAVLRGGEVVVSDSTGSLLILRRGGKALEVLVAPGTLRSPQALAPIDAGSFFVADYGTGIHRVDARTGASRRLQVAPGILTYGIDGLAYAGGSLLAIVNGYRPARVERLRLDRDRMHIVAAEIVEMGTRLDEPTNGVIAGRDFVFLASSQGHRFDGDAPDPKSSGAPTIMKVPLAP